MCRKIYFKKNLAPPCDTCRPEIVDENQSVVMIFDYVHDQVIFRLKPIISDGRIVGYEQEEYSIRHDAIHKAIELFNVKNPKWCFEGILLLFGIMKEERLIQEEL